MGKKISLIVTIYNRLEYARNIIQCLLNQNTNIQEIIFADDGSSEILMDYIEDLIPKCKFKIKHDTKTYNALEVKGIKKSWRASESSHSFPAS